MGLLTLFAEAFHAKTSAPQEKEPDLKVPVAASGLNTAASSKKSNRNTRSLKTSQPFDLEDWTEFSGASLRSGMMQNGTVFPLQPLVRLTRGTESGLWPTPTCNMISGGPNHNSPQVLAGKHGLNLAGAVTRWPTPDASPHKYRLKGDSQQSKSLNGIHGGKLNPQWVEWLMGFPVGWTDLNNSETP